MFITEKILTLRDLTAFGIGLDLFTDDRYEVVNYATDCHYRVDDDFNVTLGGGAWGKLEDLLDLEIVEFGFYDGRFKVRVEE